MAAMTDAAQRPVRIGVVDQGTEKVRHYVDAVERAAEVCGVGGAPAVGVPLECEIIDWNVERDPAADAQLFDAFVLCGGDDPPGRYFGQEDHPAITLDDPRRDVYELALCREIGARGIPTLAICRGAQMLNIALGGDIDQHLPDVPGRAAHAGGVTHALRLAEGSWLARLAGSEKARPTVNSYHHQSVGRVAESLRATAWTDDGAIEAVEANDGFVVGVQWHPERESSEAPCDQTLFDALVRAAVERRG